MRSLEVDPQEDGHDVTTVIGVPAITDIVKTVRQRRVLCTVSGNVENLYEHFVQSVGR